MTAAVDIKNVSHNYGSLQALKDVDLSLNASEYVVLLGPSGCGKTTLLSILGGFLMPSQGRILLDGKDVTNVGPVNRPTTTMFQDYALFPHMTLRSNVGFGLRMRGVGRTDRRQKAKELLSLVGLDASYQRKKPHEISGGQRQRVALARALAVEPEVLLLDEPLGALDLKLRRQMQLELKSIQKRIGTTFVHVTHDQEEAMAVADRVIVMNDGQIEDQGPPERVYLSPSCRFSASFMGETNFVEGQIKQLGDLIVVETGFGDVNLTPDKFTGNTATVIGAPVTLLFRPEHVISGHDGLGYLSLGSAQVTDVAFFGTHQRCQLQSSVITDYGFTAHIPQTTHIRHGQILPTAIPLSSIVALTR